MDQNIIFNTGETQEQLRQQYNPEGSLKRQVQLRLLDMLLYLDDVCKKLDVHYRLDGGNVLGAVRHGGFIPWDDDVDVVVENPDELKKLILFLEQHPHPQYVIQNEHTDKGHSKFWSVLRDKNSEYVHLSKKMDKMDRVQSFRGLQIDIFPYDIGCIPILKTISVKFYSIYRKLFYTRCLPLFRIFFLFQKHILNPFFQLFNKLFGDKDIYCYTYGTVWKRRIHKKISLPHQSIEFEGHSFPGPADPEAYLKIAYGNYMNLPPKDKRVHHNVDYKLGT